jgi:hypothetical protein
LPRNRTEERDLEWRRRLDNWGTWARGRAAELGYGPLPYPDFEPREVVQWDEDDARRVEALMLRLKPRRRRLYRALLVRYVWRLSGDLACADACRCSPREFYRRLSAGREWLRRAEQSHLVTTNPDDSSRLSLSGCL